GVSTLFFARNRLRVTDPTPSWLQIASARDDSLEPIFEDGGSAILISAATFLPSCSISLDLPCKSGRAERGRNSALPRDHLQSCRKRPTLIRVFGTRNPWQEAITQERRLMPSST